MGTHDMDRRTFLATTAALAAAPFLGSRAAAQTHPLAARPAHFAPKAKRAIMLFMTGGVSHVDTFDPKPKLNADHGKALRKEYHLTASLFKAKPRAKCGIEVSDLFANVGERMDDICLIRSMIADHGDHFEATLGMHTGSINFAMPSMGAWVSYGLGTYNKDLPSHVVFAKDLPYAGAQVYDSNFLPAYHQGARIVPGRTPIRHLEPIGGNAHLQEIELAMLQRLDMKHLQQRHHDDELAARMQSFTTARGLQQQAPEVFDISHESDHTLELYGMKRGDTQSFGWQCLMARRMAERGVRFIELIDTGASGNWDSHGNMRDHERLAAKVDKPIAGLLTDLKQRGLLDDTLVIWCTEFGRTPGIKDPNGKGREHHRNAFSCWLAGGGVKGGYVHGATDEYGENVIDKPVRIHDFHATILHLMGVNHEQLTYHHAGRDFRLTDVHGNIIHDLIA